MTGGLDKYWGEKGLLCIGLAFCRLFILMYSGAAATGWLCVVVGTLPLLQ